MHFASETTIRDSPKIALRILWAVIGGWERLYGDYDKSIPLIAGFDEPPVTADLIRFDLDIQRDFVRSLSRRFGDFDDSQWRSLSQNLKQSQSGPRLMSRRP